MSSYANPLSPLFSTLLFFYCVKTLLKKYDSLLNINFLKSIDKYHQHVIITLISLEVFTMYNTVFSLSQLHHHHRSGFIFKSA